jgi:hypothetical protein
MMMVMMIMMMTMIMMIMMMMIMMTLQSIIYFEQTTALLSPDVYICIYI